MAKVTPAYIGLGSNLDSPKQQVLDALNELDQSSHNHVVSCSSLYQSAPVGPQDQPNFINAVACIHTELSPLVLLDFLQSIEQAHQRKRIQHWGPRTLDLDLLLYGDDVVNHERLSVPHPFMTQRGFVLLPLFEIYPQCALPCGTCVSDLIKNCDLSDLVRLEND